MNNNQYPTHPLLHTSSSFNGYPVQVNYQPLMVNNLLIHERVLMKALSYHKRTCALRFELKFPKNFVLMDSRFISKFFDSLRVRIKLDLVNKNRRTGRNDKCYLSYIWVYELSSKGEWHFHVIIFLNHDIYNCFGSLKRTEGNMYSRVRASWASAINLSFDEVSGLIHIPNNAAYKINVNSEYYEQQVHDVLYRLSYFAKTKTKPYGEGSGTRFFGYSAL